MIPTTDYTTAFHRRIKDIFPQSDLSRVHLSKIDAMVRLFLRLLAAPRSVPMKHEYLRRTIGRALILEFTHLLTDRIRPPAFVSGYDSQGRPIFTRDGPYRYSAANAQVNPYANALLHAAIEAHADFLADMIAEHGEKFRLIAPSNMRIAEEFDINLSQARKVFDDLGGALQSAQCLAEYNAQHNEVFTIQDAARRIAQIITTFHDLNEWQAGSFLYERAEDSGRFYLKGDILNFQTMTRTTRKAFFSGLGYYDVDQESAHPSIMLGILERAGIDTYREYRPLHDVVHEKSRIRRDLEAAHDLSTDKVKMAIAGIFYGSDLSGFSSLAYDIFGTVQGNPENEARLSRLRNDPFLRDLMRTRDKATETIIALQEAQASQPGRVRLAHGAEIDFAHYPKRSQILARINQSEESVILQRCLDQIGPSMAVLQHDGFTSTADIDHAALGQHVSGQVGYAVTYSKDEL